MGTLPPYKTAYIVKGSLPDPALALARELDHALTVKGIDVSGAATSVHLWSSEADKALVTSKNHTIIDSLQSPTLAELAAQTNIFSLNLYAETLLRWVGQRLKSQTTTAASTEAMAEYWLKQGLDGEGLFLTDGCGMSMGNGITPFHFTDLLAQVGDSTPAGKAFIRSLAVMGRSGTVESMGKGTLAEGRMRLKSGTLTRVLCYTGYATTKVGEPVTFALMVNRYSGSFGDMKKQIEKLLVGICE
jgi:D-alanyl-D-alanine carboxypeptidase/D-alanyl-D-alanine-endopeptidase (penicillin-binding protein 4)